MYLITMHLHSDLDGDPGVGKTELIQHMLRGYKQVSLDNPPTEEDKDIYYNIPASLSPKVKADILRQAFIHGAIVIMDEVNANEKLEGIINRYLMGDEEKPLKPGFTILGTYNSGLNGRKELSPAFKSRGICTTLQEYTKDELIVILQNKYPSSSIDVIEEMIVQFLADQSQARRNPNLPMPTVRELFTRAERNLQDKFKSRFDGILSGYGVPGSNRQSTEPLPGMLFKPETMGDKKPTPIAPGTVPPSSRPNKKD